MIRYIKNTIKIRLNFEWVANLKNLLSYSLVNYIDSNFAKDLEDYNLVIGYYFFYDRVIVL